MHLVVTTAAAADRKSRSGRNARVKAMAEVDVKTVHGETRG